MSLEAVLATEGFVFCVALFLAVVVLTVIAAVELSEIVADRRNRKQALQHPDVIPFRRGRRQA